MTETEGIGVAAAPRRGVPGVRWFRELLARPAARPQMLFLDLRRLAVFLFALLVVTGALLSVYYRPSPDGAFESLVAISNTVHFGWFVRSLHRVTGHALVAVMGVFLLRAFFKRAFLLPRAAGGWRIAVAFSLVCLALLVTGESLPWNQSAYWQTVVNTNLVAEIPVVGGWLGEAARGGPQVTGQTLNRVYAMHALVLPWIAFGLLILVRDRRRKAGAA
jgi:quinol-cytochrome oxidoreductase complex cytochrome b subunit